MSGRLSVTSSSRRRRAAARRRDRAPPAAARAGNPGTRSTGCRTSRPRSATTSGISALTVLGDRCARLAHLSSLLSRRMSRHDHHLPRPGRGRRGLRLGLLPGRDRGDRRLALALGDRRARPAPGARRVRRPGGDLHRLAVRRQRGARRDRRDLVGRAGADQSRRHEPDAPDRADDAARRAAHRADQRQRRRRRAAAGRRRDGGAARPLALAAAPAARVRRARGLAARADGHAGERDRLGGRRRGRRRAASATSSSRSSGVPLLLGTIAIVVLLGERLLPTRSARDAAAPTSATTRGRSSSSTSSSTTPTTLLNRKYGVAEVVIPPRSSAIGETVLPGHGHRQRRPRRSSPCSETARTSARTRRCSRSATRCCCAGSGPRSTRTSTIRRCSSSTRPRSSGGRRCRSGRGRSAALVVLARDGRAPRHGRGAAGRRRAARRRARSSCCACSASSSAIARSRGRP